MQTLKRNVMTILITVGLLFLTTAAWAGELEGKIVYVDGVQTEITSSNIADYWQHNVKAIGYTSPEANTFYDYFNGYSIQYPSDMKIDLSDGDIRTVFYNDECRIEVYRQSLANATYGNYTYYSNLFLQNTTDHLGQYVDNAANLSGKTAYLTKWYREPLKALEKDYHYYVTADFKRSSADAYSIFIKSTRDISGEAKYMDVLQTLNWLDYHGQPYQKQFLESDTEKAARIGSKNAETKEVLYKYFGETSPLTWGIFEPGAPALMEKLRQLEYRLDYHFKFLVMYHHLFDITPIQTVVQRLQDAYDNNHLVELTLQTTDSDEGNMVYDVLNGERDEYLNAYAQAIAKFEHPVLLRVGNEMNGDWCVYSAHHTSKDVEIYKAFYRYLYEIFEVNGANNVLWIWNPNEKSFPGFAWNDMTLYYPGHEYVDIVGMTGYNTGSFYPGESWRTFDEIYAPLYAQYTAMFNKPLMITEFSSSSIGGDKAAWIEDMFTQIAKYPKIKVAMWWSGCDWLVPNEIPARIYWIDESEAILDVFKSRLPHGEQQQKNTVNKPETTKQTDLEHDNTISADNRDKQSE